jgi:CheY-like chemotaxis protein
VKTILVAEDEHALAEAIAAVLEDEGFRVVQAHNGRQALEVVDESAPDAIVLDYMMPVMNGAAVLAALRARRSAPPVILVSAAADTEVLRECSGHSAFLRKPFSAQALVDAVRAATRS